MAEDLVFRDVRRFSENPVINSCDQEVSFSYCGDSVRVSEGSSTSSRDWGSSEGFGVPENTYSEPKDVTVHSRLEIIESNNSSGSINVVLKGYYV